MTTSDYGYPPRLIRNPVRGPPCRGGNKLAEDPNTSVGHGPRELQLAMGAWARWEEGLEQKHAFISIYQIWLLIRNSPWKGACQQLSGHVQGASG
jgi:hypothetical protein